eukprot:SAG11_NODE_22028_length_413_cov_2.528662_1_plen_47_part_10
MAVALGIGLAQWNSKLGFGNAMVLELKDFEDLNEMLQFADAFMDQTV